MHDDLKLQISEAENPDGSIDLTKVMDAVFKAYGGYDAPCGPQASSSERAVRRSTILNAVLDNRQMLITLIENLPLGVALFDKTDCLIHCNALYARHLALSRETSLVGRHIHDLMQVSIRETTSLDDSIMDVVKAMLAELKEHGEVLQTWRSGDGLYFRVQGRFLVDGSWICLHENVTERVIAELKMAESEQRFRDFAEMASDRLWEIDKNNNYTFISHKTGQIDGIPVEEIIGKPYGALGVIEEDMPYLERHLEQVRDRKPFSNFITRRRTPDGKLVWHQVSGAPRFDEQGRYLGYRGIGRNLTEQKKIEATLVLNEERFRDFSETGNDWCWETDRNHCFTFFSPTFAQRTGLDPKTYLGRGILVETCHPDDLHVVTTFVARMNAHQPIEKLIYRRARSDGQYVWIQVSAKPFFDSAGLFAGFRGTGSIVTEEQESKLALNQTTKVLRDFAEASSDWFWETDSKHRFCKVQGLPDDSLMTGLIPHFGQELSQLDVHPDDRTVLHRCQKIMETNEPFRNIRFRKRGEDGEWLWLNMRGNPVFDERQRFSGYRGALTDETKEALQQEAARQESLALERSQTIARIGHCRWQLTTNKVEWSAPLFDIFGFHRRDEPPSASNFLKRIHPDDFEKVMACFQQSMTGEEIPYLEFRYLPRNREEEIYCRLKVMVELENGKPVSLFGIVQDITDIKTTQRLLAERSEELLNAQKLGKIGDWSFRLDSQKVTWGRELYELMRYDPATFTPTVENTAELYVDDEYSRILQLQKEAARSGEIHRLDVRGRRGDGTIGDYVFSTKTINDKYGRIIGFSGTLQDISDRKQAEQQLERLAYFDPLTGLANRALFSQQIEPVIADAEVMEHIGALLLLDLDRFKEVNDSLGHASGDELLYKVSKILMSNLPQDHFLARLGGDEFAVILPKAESDEHIRQYADRLIDVLDQPIQLERGDVHIGVSIGVAFIPKDGNTTETLLRHADLALYSAKEEGRGCVAYFCPQLNTAAQNKVALERDLRSALASFEGIESRYQPQIDLVTNKVMGFETLMRWKHPARGYISPVEFIPIAENAGMIGDLGLWILRDSLNTARTWLDLGEPPREISVNISAAQIWQTDIAGDIAMVLEQSRLPPHLLCLELTESLFADHAEDRVIKTLQALKQLGVTLAIDDFGTGYSSLGYLNQLPFDKLKIDRVFVNGIVESKRKRKLLEGIIALGHGLGMTVIAEGAEQPEEIQLLCEFGCDWVQGYVFSRPVLSHEALVFARELDGQTAQTSPLPLLKDSPSLDMTATPEEPLDGWSPVLASPAGKALSD